MAIQIIRTLQGSHPIKDYPFPREGIAYFCTLCKCVWLKEKEAKEHDCKPIDD